MASNRRLSFFFTFVAALLLVSQSSPSRAFACDIPQLSDEEWAFVELINDYRSQYGLQPLQVSQTSAVTSMAYCCEGMQR